jgi:Kef-type K+ transport system membrane component KefB
MDLNQGLVDLVAVALVAALAPLVVAAVPGPRIPQVVILLIGGVLIGPHVLGLAETSNIQLLANIGLGFLSCWLATSWIRSCCGDGRAS